MGKREKEIIEEMKQEKETCEGILALSKKKGFVKLSKRFYLFEPNKYYHKSLGVVELTSEELLQLCKLI